LADLKINFFKGGELMLVEVVSGGVVSFNIVVEEEEIPLLLSLHGWPTPHIKWLQASICDAALIWGPPFMEEDFTGCLGVIVFVSVRLSLQVTRFWDWASLGFLDSCK
jgi:hypothetical protein